MLRKPTQKKKKKIEKKSQKQKVSKIDFFYKKGTEKNKIK
jgi:hypothetical protein